MKSQLSLGYNLFLALCDIIDEVLQFSTNQRSFSSSTNLACIKICSFQEMNVFIFLSLSLTVNERPTFLHQLNVILVILA